MEKEATNNKEKSTTLTRILAILEIIFSSYKILSALLAGGIFLFFSRSTLPFTEMEDYYIYVIALSSVGLIIAILALVSAIGILCWKDWARQLMIWAAAGAIAVNLISPFLSYIPNNKISSFSFSSMGVIFLIYFIVSITLSVAYNSFIIWYFNRAKTKLIFAERKV